MPNGKTRCIGVLTAGGDCPGLNAAIRSVAKSALHYGIRVVGILDGFRGLVENRSIPIEEKTVSGVLTSGGTILGTNRDKPHKMKMGGKVMDMTEAAVANARRLQIDCLVCLGGNGTQKNALHMHEAGMMNVLTLPKTIDNDVACTDVCFGFDTAMSIATEAIDRLHSTASSHHRVMICEVMGHDAGWLALGSGIAGGADVILIPEIPYNLKAVSDHLIERRQDGKRFSIIVVAEGAIPARPGAEGDVKRKARRAAQSLRDDDSAIGMVREPQIQVIARQLEAMTGIDVRVTSLGHVQRGGCPSAYDRLLCTRMGTVAGQLLAEARYNVMVGVSGKDCVPVPLEEVVASKKLVPLDHSWIESARLVETCLGD